MKTTRAYVGGWTRWATGLAAGFAALAMASTAGYAQPSPAPTAAPVAAPAPTAAPAAEPAVVQPTAQPATAIPAGAATTQTAPAGKEVLEQPQVQKTGNELTPAGGQPPVDPNLPKQQAWYDKLAASPWDQGGGFWMPTRGNLAGDSADTMFYVSLALSAFFFFAIAIVTVYFVVKYRHRPGHKSEPSPSHNNTLELTWTIIPTIICVFLFAFGWRGYMHMTAVPQNALEIQVDAQKWAWTFTHKNGGTDSNLHVPVNTPVRLVMKAKDVLHSFWVPAFRIKQDLIPNRYTYVWFEATKPGVYRLYCTEYCGRNHSIMKQTVVVHEAGGYERYLSDIVKPPETPEGFLELGAKLYEKKGCNACHSINGSRVVGPSFKGIWGETAQMQDGSSIVVDENYVRESIINPNAHARVGYPAGGMSSFAGIKDFEIRGLIEYIKSLK